GARDRAQRVRQVLFNSYVFGAFALVVFAVYFLGLPWRVRKLFLLAMSYLFYAAWNAPYLLLILASTLLDFWAAQRLAAARGRLGRQAFLMLSLAGNLGVLSYFKYGGFALAEGTALLARIGIVYEPMEWSVLLPIGISFYTFQTLSYTIDVYRGRIAPTRSLADFALYVTFFPQLVAGPIVRARKFMPQLAQPPAITAEAFGWGLTLVLIGLFQKVFVADGLMAPITDRVFAAEGLLPAITVIAGLSAFGVQILCDFSGYSLIAIGLAQCLGFSLPENFRAPAASIGYRDLWQRWHISLSSWFRDYVYAPLRGRGKGRHSLARILPAQLATMTLIGLWHGAGWTFILWGAYNGAILALETVLRRIVGHWTIWQGRAMKLCFILITAGLFAFSGSLFRARDLDHTADLWASLVRPAELNLYPSTGDFAILALTHVVLMSLHIALRRRRLATIAETLPIPARLALVTLMMSAIALVGGENEAFIYFQF
ncbi:MAG: MBOAT family protein, partial [Alphaproteobacteria bacterium]|nr:MBOAT family protein [Alphaproteobacteria bacterium]